MWFFSPFSGGFRGLEARGLMGLESPKLPPGQERGGKCKGVGKGAKIIQG